MAKTRAKKPKTGIGTRLARQRRQAQLTRQDVAKRLGLSASDVRNIENDRLELLPGGVSAKDVVRQFALLVGANPADYETPGASLAEPESRVIVTLSKTTTSLLVLIVMLAVGGFLLWRIVNALALPTLNIHQPAQGVTLNQPAIIVSGQSSQQAQVFVNDVDVPLNPDGSWSTEVILSPGPNDIRVTAINSFGRQSSQSRTVIYQPQ